MTDDIYDPFHAAIKDLPQPDKAVIYAAMEAARADGFKFARDYDRRWSIMGGIFVVGLMLVLIVGSAASAMHQADTRACEQAVADIEDRCLVVLGIVEGGGE